LNEKLRQALGIDWDGCNFSDWYIFISCFDEFQINWETKLFKELLTTK